MAHNKKPVVYKKEIIKSLKDLMDDYPNQSLAQHIALATCEYKDISIISDKEFSFLLNKYIGELSLDMHSHIVTEDDKIFEELDYFDDDEEIYDI